MDLAGLDHVTIRTRPQDVDRMRDFYRDVVGLNEGKRAAFTFPGYWMYLGGRPVVHVAGTLAADAPDPQGPGHTGQFDHVSFHARGMGAIRSQLQKIGLPFKEVPVPGLDIHQIFFHDPVGIKVELTFYNESHAAAQP